MRIARERIDPDADKVVRRLSRHGHQAYLVGGCVRDLLLGRTPKDFDVATSATPKEIKQLFRNCRIIGRRFRLAHIFFGGKVIETSTFRAKPPRGDESGELLIRRDNVFGTDTEDAQRRDFTINGLFYDVEQERVIDHVGGIPDLETRVISTIGDPDIRFQEDPVRMLRAIKFAARLGFTIAPSSYQAILDRRSELTKCAQPRVIEELYRLLRGGAARRSVELMVETHVIATLSIHLAQLFRDWRPPEGDNHSPNELKAPRAWSFLQDATEINARRDVAYKMLAELDEMFRRGEEVSNALVLSSLLAPFVIPTILGPDLTPLEANQVVEELLMPLSRELQIARRDAERTRQILLAQRRLSPARRRRDKPMSLVRRDYFEETLRTYELLGRASGHEDREDVEYWRRLQQAGSANETQRRSGKRRRRRRGGRRRRRGMTGSDVGDENSDPAPAPQENAGS